ncbi:MAG TPA: acylneuraminate cytidylyltransferase family protein [Gemmatimonadaceae bacterium]|nr:acylneuraminate cytidylyltransferase family protein [Gemmatimonadaceae bacterium]
MTGPTGNGACGMRVLGVIPARGGSKGVPRKNVRLLAGRPLLQYTADAALAARRLTRVVLSTDDEEVADVGRRCGLDVPFLRPAVLARHDTPTLPVVQHALAVVEQAGEHYDAVCLLQPTAPLRRAAHIDGCITMLEERGADCVFTVLPVPAAYNPHWVYLARADGLLALSTGEATPPSRRQELPPAYHREGSVYVTRRDVVMCQGSLYGTRVLGYALDGDQSVNIDDARDWLRAEALVRATRAVAELAYEPDYG